MILAAAAFETPLLATVRAKGFSALPYVTVPRVYNNLDAAASREQTFTVVEVLLDLLDPAGREGLEPPDSGAQDAVPSIPQRHDFGHDTSTAAASRELAERGWSDGNVTLPPRTDVVDELVAAYADQIDPDAPLFSIPPGQGTATLRLIAANAAMAGCEPDDLPFVVTCLRTIEQMREPFRTIGLSSTTSHGHFFVVNGPAREHLGDDVRRNQLGPGTENLVSQRIMRALVMSLRNLGQWKPGVLDNDVMGSPRKYGMIVAENETESPWPSYAADAGFDPAQSTISMVVTSGEWDIGFQGQTSIDNLIRAIAAKNGVMDLMGYFRRFPGQDDPHEGRLLLMSPAHAGPIAEAGLSKRETAERLHEAMRAPARQLMEPLRKLAEQGNIQPRFLELFDASDEELEQRLMPIVNDPDDIRIVVCGSIRGKNMMFPTMGAVTLPLAITHDVAGG